MRYLTGFMISALIIIACNHVDKTNTTTASQAAQANEDTSTYTTIQWIDSVKDYGTLTEGQKLDVSFRFKNTGNKPLIIRSIRPGCGCTQTTNIDEPIAPGAESEVKASFNSSGHPGLNEKDIFVDANTKGTIHHKIHFKVEVEKPKTDKAN